MDDRAADMRGDAILRQLRGWVLRGGVVPILGHEPNGAESHSVDLAGLVEPSLVQPAAATQRGAELPVEQLRNRAASDQERFNTARVLSMLAPADKWQQQDTRTRQSLTAIPILPDIPTAKIVLISQR